MRLAMGLTTGLHEVSVELLYAHPERLHRQLAWWRERGIEGVVLYDTLPDFYRIPPAQFAALGATIRAAGLEIAAFNALRKSLFLPEFMAAETARCDHILAVCRVLRPAIVDLSVNVPIPQGLEPSALASRTLFRGDYASDEAYRMAAAYLKPFARSCGEFGAALSLELHDDGLQDTADGCLKLLRLIDEPNVGTNPDIGNWYRVPYEQRGTWRDQLAQLAPSTNYWEVKNYRRLAVPDARRAYSWVTDLADGDMDFREAAVSLRRAGFRGWVCNEGGTGDRIQATLRYIAYMRWILDEWLPLVKGAEGE